MAKITSDSLGGEVIIAQPVGDFTQPDQTTALDESAADAESRRRGIENLAATLPANQAVQPNINFLGSSYSGVDIKVIAHLYDTANWRDDQISKLETEKGNVDALVQGLVSLVEGGFAALADDGADANITYEEKRDAFKRATTLSENVETEQSALNTLFSAVFRNAMNSSFTFLATARGLRTATRMKQEYEARQEELANEIVRTMDLQEDSSTTIALGDLQTISIQSHREKFAVRALGHSYSKGYTRGTRTIAGSMIFTVFDQHPLRKLMAAMGTAQTGGEKDMDLTTLLPDQLPPIDLTISFANEYGSRSSFRIYGLEFMNDGVTYSIEDLLSEEVMNFVCRDIDIMVPHDRVQLHRSQKGMFNDKDDKGEKTGTSLLFGNKDYGDYLEKLKLRRKFKRL